MQVTIFKNFKPLQPGKKIQPRQPNLLVRSGIALMISTSLVLTAHAKDNISITPEQTKQPNINAQVPHISQTKAIQATSLSPDAVFPTQVAKVMQKVELNANDISFIITPLSDNKLVPVEPKPKESAEALETIDTIDTTDKTSQAMTDTPAHSPSLPPLSASRYQAKIPRTPASTMKLIPTFVALDTLGKDFFWMTNVYYTGQIIGNSLYGDLVIKGSGDPKLTHQKIEHLLYQVTQAGIHHIEGDIILDSNIFGDVGKDPAKFDGEPLRPYNASPDGLLVNFNAMSIDSYPLSNGRSQLLYTPKLADVDLPKTIGSRADRCSSNIALSLAPRWRYDGLSYGKSMPNACQRYTFYIAYPNPKTFAQQVIKAKWLEQGNTLAGEVRDSNHNRIHSPKLSKLSYFAKDSLQTAIPYPIATAVSYPLSKQIYDINHHSNNVMTEQLLLSISTYQAYANSNGRIKPTTDYRQALSTVKQWWQSNLTSSPPYMTNGSGLCRECTLTVANLDELQGKAYAHPDFATYVGSLGVAGVSGTIETHKDRMPESSAIGRAWIKTGTLGNVTAMAGYVKGRSGQEYSVVGIINLDKDVRSANKYRPVLDSMIDWVAQH